MKLDIVEPEVIKPPKEFILTLSEQEAAVVKRITSLLVGNSPVLRDLKRSLVKVNQYLAESTVTYDRHGDLSVNAKVSEVNSSW